MKNIDCKKFTLIELLIVIAIIGILVTLLLPSLERSRKASKQALSMSNFKQIHMATMAYATQNNNWLFDHATNWHPAAGINWETGGRSHVMDWQRMAYESMIGKVLSRDEASVHMDVGTTFFNTFYCPVLRDSRVQPNSVSTHGDGDYSMNRFFITQRNLLTLTGEKEPIYVAGTIKDGDPSRASNNFRNGVYNPTSQYHPAYEYINQKTLSLFIDGSVKMLSKIKGAEINAAIQNNHDFQ